MLHFTKYADLFVRILKRNFYNFFRVIDSKYEKLPIGTNVSGAMGCRTHAVMPGRKLTNLDFLGDLPPSYGIGVAGLSG